MPYLTENYSLKKPTQEETSDIDVINENMDVIDIELGHANDEIQTVKTSKCEVVFGTYTGDGETSRFIDLGFTPVAVEVYAYDGEQFSIYGTNRMYGGLALKGYPCGDGSSDIIEISDNGFYVAYQSSYYGTNYKNKKYYFIAYKNGEIMEV